jgi:hypothetical protein
MKLVLELPEDLAKALSEVSFVDFLRQEVEYRRFALAESEWQEALAEMRAAGTDPDALLEEARQEAWERYRQEHRLD